MQSNCFCISNNEHLQIQGANASVHLHIVIIIIIIINYPYQLLLIRWLYSKHHPDHDGNSSWFIIKLLGFDGKFCPFKRSSAIQYICYTYKNLKVRTLRIWEWVHLHHSCTALLVRAFGLMLNRYNNLQ